MQIQNHPNVEILLRELLNAIQNVLQEKLVGLYVYGSLAWGDFDEDISDIDLLAALADDLTPREADAIQAMHSGFVLLHPQWDNRIETQYFARRGLETFRSETHPMGNISPGEPFHIIQVDRAWLMNWYFVQTYGVTLYGPAPDTLIPPISKAEFFDAVREHVQYWKTTMQVTHDDPPYRSYAVLTMCRALCSLDTGEQVSKRAAVSWAETHLPEWFPIIRLAFSARRNPADGCPTYKEAARFVEFANQYIQK